MFRDSKGATAIEYGLIAGLVAVAAIGATKSVGSWFSHSMDNVSARLGTDAGPGPSNDLATASFAVTPTNVAGFDGENLVAETIVGEP